jgi:hypothetical protein
VSADAPENVALGEKVGFIGSLVDETRDVGNKDMDPGTD